MPLNLGALGKAVRTAAPTSTPGIGSTLAGPIAGALLSPQPGGPGGQAVSGGTTISNPNREGGVIILNSSAINSGSILEPFLQGSDANGSFASIGGSRFVAQPTLASTLANTTVGGVNLWFLAAIGIGAWLLLR